MYHSNNAIETSSNFIFYNGQIVIKYLESELNAKKIFDSYFVQWKQSCEKKTYHVAHFGNEVGDRFFPLRAIFPLQKWETRNVFALDTLRKLTLQLLGKGIC